MRKAVVIGCIGGGLALIALAGSAVKGTDDAGSGSAQRPGTPPASAAAAPPSAQLPAARVDATTVLGRSRVEVRKALGQHTKETAELDNFARDAMMFVVVYDRNVAVNLAVATTSGWLDEAATRAWLGLPASGNATIGKRVYRVALQKDLNALMVTDAEWGRREEERAAAAAAKQKQEQLVQSRLAFAEALDTNFLDNGWDAKVLVRGTTLRIEFVLCNRAFLHQVVRKDETAIPTLKGLGFKVVECSDGFNKTSRFDL